MYMVHGMYRNRIASSLLVLEVVDMCSLHQVNYEHVVHGIYRDRIVSSLLVQEFADTVHGNLYLVYAVII